MLAQPFEEKRLARWPPPYLIQPKLDGERCRALIGESGEVVLLSSEENIIFSCPHIVAALQECGLKGVELDGELYCHEMPLEEIHSRVSRRINEHADSEAIEYHIFDIIGEGDQSYRLTQLIANRTRFNLPLRLVSTAVAESLDQIMLEYDRIIKEGYEGIIVRHISAPYERKRSLWVMKFKPKKEDVYEIVGCKEEISINGVPKGALGALVCRGDDGTTFPVGSGFDADQRSLLWEERATLPGRMVRVKYQHLTPGRRVPRSSVFIEIFDPSAPYGEG